MLTEFQLKLRKQGIGGSDIGAICGINPWKSQIDVYMDKLDLVPEKKQTERMKHGLAAEPMVTEIYKYRTSKDVLNSFETIISDKYPFLLANVDRLIEEDNGILEIKTVSSFEKYRSKNGINWTWGEENTDDIPISYLLQCAHYAHILNADYVDVAVLRIDPLYTNMYYFMPYDGAEIDFFNSLTKNDFRLYRYERNIGLEDLIIEKAKYFWNENILKKIPPKPVDSLDSLKLLGLCKLESKVASITEQQICDDIKFLTREKNIIEEKLHLSKERLKLIMEKYDLLLSEDRESVIASYKEYKKKSINEELLKDENPDLYEKVLDFKSYRKLDIK